MAAALLVLTTPTNPGEASWTPSTLLPTGGPTQRIEPGENADIGADTEFVTIDTTDFEPLIFLAPLADVIDGHAITFRIVAGALSAIINPANLDEGVNGPPGSIYELDALEEFVTFRADTTLMAWWKV
jgi:hypothetical protein